MGVNFGYSATLILKIFVSHDGKVYAESGDCRTKLIVICCRFAVNVWR